MIVPFKGSPWCVFRFAAHTLRSIATSLSSSANFAVSQCHLHIFDVSSPQTAPRLPRSVETSGHSTNVPPQYPELFRRVSSERSESPPKTGVSSNVRSTGSSHASCSSADRLSRSRRRHCERTVSIAALRTTRINQAAGSSGACCCDARRMKAS